MLIRAGLFSYAIISEAHHRKWKDIYLLSTSLSADVARRELRPKRAQSSTSRSTSLWDCM